MASLETIERFTSLTRYPLTEFLTEARDFFRNDLAGIVSFFKGDINFLDKEKVNRLNRLAENSIIVTNLFFEKRGILQTVDYWDLLDRVEDIKTRLQYSQNISKYLRSSILDGTNRSGFVFDYVLSNQQTLEDATDVILEETNFENSWSNQAIENDLQEIDWDIDGGKNLKLRKQLFQANLVTSMIDNTIGERIYGRDIKRLFEYENDDLRVLGYKETVFQTVDILGGLKKGDIPEFKNIGMESDIYTGANVSQLNYPSIVREMRKLFETDDLFSDFSIRDIRYENGDVSIEYEVNTKFELTIIRNASL